MNLDDLFEMQFGSVAQGPKLAATERHLVHDICDDDGWTTAADSEDVLTCKQCGSLVLAGNAEVHLGWHRLVEPLLADQRRRNAVAAMVAQAEELDLPY